MLEYFEFNPAELNELIQNKEIGDKQDYIDQAAAFLEYFNHRYAEFKEGEPDFLIANFSAKQFDCTNEHLENDDNVSEKDLILSEISGIGDIGALANLRIGSIFLVRRTF